MGIRVVCPNGHKLNVKSFLAGKRGVCPHCGAKFDIPAGAKDEASDDRLQSVGTVSAGSGAGPAAAASTSSAEMRAGHLAKGTPARSVAPVASPGMAPALPISSATQPLPAAAPVVPVAAVQPTAGVSMPIGAQPVAQTLLPGGVVQAPAVPSVPGVPAARAAMADPLAEAPEACWYVRPPAGGQYGPAKANIMRQWIAEGRVTADSLVWREGWADWKLAGATFPSLGAASVMAAAPSAPAAVAAMPVSSADAGDPFTALAPNASSSSSRRPITPRRSDGAGRFMAIAVLCVALVILSALLVYVLKLQ
jgi:hypothetical protein